ncbi:hypothetical protein KR018_001549, partial [Drosophila ironensis]
MHSEMAQRKLQCRICLLQPKDKQLLPTPDDFPEKIRSCTGIQLTHSSRAPSGICNGCNQLLQAALKLRFLCEEAEKKLQPSVQIHVQIEDVTQGSGGQKKGSQSNQPKVEFVEYEVTLNNIKDEHSNAKESIRIERVHSRPPSPMTEDHLMSEEEDDEPQNYLRPAGSFPCTECRNVYDKRQRLTAHMKVHSEDKPHECEICHKRFRQTPQLARHMNTHTGQRPYKCDYCDSCFGDPSTRIKHQRIHTNERPYKCTYCPKSFSYSNVLQVHLITHTGQRPFSCQYCDKTFSQLHHKNAHERSHKPKKKPA